MFSFFSLYQTNPPFFCCFCCIVPRDPVLKPWPKRVFGRSTISCSCRSANFNYPWPKRVMRRTGFRKNMVGKIRVVCTSCRGHSIKQFWRNQTITKQFLGNHFFLGGIKGYFEGFPEKKTIHCFGW